ncbi:hypothetical protein CANTEDRAFT_102877 [Yamadazyma tenuis ATCC 10573]|uniref:Uncharacterized protein n=2 Tax=Candida tenuis TaxID=2315449 RepID=G3B0F7_CANTC|nr:uncharacterized protein CANTEDRAFT_102877 [Yamadazyma tenuis ATCC 10573]EGV65391.1 hypothetical protein CANTEDRAFT_102877 [Yamadazyma tenuis ATCC 10573]
MAPPSHHLHPQAPAQQAQQPPTGGINSVLEYDLTNMSTFLSWCAFGMLKQNRNPTKDFEGLVNSVLFATRLPKSTIIIALEYMNQRFSSKGINTLSESEIFIKLIVGLILGNKFNDDNTFTNRSWCGATGLQISVLNEEEMTWLQEVKWNLNVVNFESNIITLEECWKTWLEKYTPKDVSVSTYSSPVYSNPSIPSSPVSPDYNVYYPSSSPTLPYSNSSPTKYSDAMWNPQQPVPHLAVQSLPSNANVNHHQHQHQHQHQNSIWSYTPNYPNNLPISHQPIQYLNSNFVGYTNPYYTFNMASC